MAVRPRSSTIALIVLWASLVAVALFAGRAVWARPLPEPQGVQARPSLAVAPLLSATAGQPIDVPLTYDSGGRAIDTAVSYTHLSVVSC